MTIWATDPAAQIARRVVSGRFDEWAAQVSSTGFCSRPIRLVGSSDRFSSSTGEQVGSFDTKDLPDGVLYVRCGNRRASECPSCSREYQGDYWHLVTAGVAGGSKGVPTSVATHPLVFATLTAPSFGPVHSVKKPGSRSPACRPRGRSRFCDHGAVVSCNRTHGIDDPEVGSPLCSRCYDYAGHIVWQWHASELWRRFTIALRRALAKHLGVSERVCRDVARLQYAKVVEYQRRGAVHFHALIRLDGPATEHEAFASPQAPVSSEDLAAVVVAAVRAVRLVVPGVDGRDTARELSFGQQVDARAVDQRALGSGDVIEPRRVAGYLAKYVTKAAAESAPGGWSSHFIHLRSCARALGLRARRANGHESPYLLLAKWSRALGFRGHVASKSRHFSTTLGQLRDDRRRFHHERAPTSGPAVVDLDIETDDATTTTLSRFRYAGSGWLNSVDAALAAEAAVAARENQESRARKRCSRGLLDPQVTTRKERP